MTAECVYIAYMETDRHPSSWQPPQVPKIGPTRTQTFTVFPWGKSSVHVVPTHRPAELSPGLCYDCETNYIMAHPPPETLELAEITLFNSVSTVSNVFAKACLSSRELYSGLCTSWFRTARGTRCQNCMPSSAPWQAARTAQWQHGVLVVATHL